MHSLCIDDINADSNNERATHSTDSIEIASLLPACYARSLPHVAVVLPRVFFFCVPTLLSRDIKFAISQRYVSGPLRTVIHGSSGNHDPLLINAPERRCAKESSLARTPSTVINVSISVTKSL